MHDPPNWEVKSELCTVPIYGAIEVVQAPDGRRKYNKSTGRELNNLQVFFGQHSQSAELQRSLYRPS